MTVLILPIGEYTQAGQAPPPWMSFVFGLGLILFFIGHALAPAPRRRRSPRRRGRARRRWAADSTSASHDDFPMYYLFEAAHDDGADSFD